jgi:hypothetical protein
VGNHFFEWLDPQAFNDVLSVLVIVLGSFFPFGSFSFCSRQIGVFKSIVALDAFLPELLF